jgi:glutamate-5-semialdehyde dehydrogenase
MGTSARSAARKLALASTEAKNRALEGIAAGLLSQEAAILRANQSDCAQARQDGLTEAMLDRLLLDHGRLEGMARDVRAIAQMPDPVGEGLEQRTLPNGLQVSRVRVPLGVIASIYESRPNVTIDIASLCLKSGNATILRGGKESLNSSIELVRLVREACGAVGLPEDCVQLIDTPDRMLVGELLRMDGYIDLMIPRGGASLIEFVRDNATMPVVAGGVGVCHTYVDASADPDKALEIVYNAKCRRYTICNALDTVLVHRQLAGSWLPRMASRFAGAGVSLHCDLRALSILGAGSGAIEATEDDWGKEFLDLIAAVKVVDSLDEALEHIEHYGSGHSEAIITQDYSAAQRFLHEVDAAAVYVNASTQFTDGGQFGLGAEVGISTQKMHARGPMGLRELTSYKWVILGDGQIRPA